MKPDELEVGVKNLKHLKEGGILIECRSDQEVQKLRREAEQKLTGYSVKIPNKTNPAIKIVDIEKGLAPGDLKKIILRQNDFLQSTSLKFDVRIV